MREIKFRAWDTNKKEMLYELDNKGYNEDLMKPFDNLDLDYYKIMQFIGLLGKNKKEIYEGDIVKDTKFEKNNIEVVEFSLKDLGFMPFTRPMSYGEYEPVGRTHFSYEKECEIIGNIYENPELLKNE